jgi:GMP synthase-like glutamine amidotransferase
MGIMGKALVLVHEAVPGRGEQEVGTVGPALTGLGLDPLVTTLVGGGPAVPDLAEVAVLVVLGAAESAADDTVPWLGAELDLMRRAVATGTPVLGICFGAQALARVLGGTVGRAPRSERGFVALGSAAPDLLPAGEWLQFHDDAFTLPPGGQALASNDVGLQAFAHGPHLGVQFHPEITPAAFAAWVGSWEESGVAEVLAAEVDLPALRADLVARSAATEDACHDLVTRFATHAGVLVP